jgi:lambda repressor-like predicted transcriptional regulator
VVICETQVATTTRPRSTFGDQLRAELERQEMSIRKLARRMNPDNPGIARRSLHKWIAGTRPSPASRLVVAEALGVEASTTFPDSDDSEDP